MTLADICGVCGQMQKHWHSCPISHLGIQHHKIVFYLSGLLLFQGCSRTCIPVPEDQFVALYLTFDAASPPLGQGSVAGGLC